MIPLENVWFFLNISIENKSRVFTPTNSPHFNSYPDGSHTCVCVWKPHYQEAGGARGTSGRKLSKLYAESE